MLWKLSLGVTGLVLVVVMWQCGSALVQGRELSAKAVRHFHEQLNSGNFQEIFDQADEEFQRSGTRQESVAFLEVVHRKLGNADVEYLRNLNATVNTSGTFITAVYNTQFDDGWAVETFVWQKQGHELQLRTYHIQSRDLIMK